eukprot:6204737-Pleurochrysis_carterae.AAC.1
MTTCSSSPTTCASGSRTTLHGVHYGLQARVLSHRADESLADSCYEGLMYALHGEMASCGTATGRCGYTQH